MLDVHAWRTQYAICVCVCTVYTTSSFQGVADGSSAGHACSVFCVLCILALPCLASGSWTYCVIQQSSEVRLAEAEGSGSGSGSSSGSGCDCVTTHYIPPLTKEPRTVPRCHDCTTVHTFTFCTLTTCIHAYMHTYHTRIRTTCVCACVRACGSKKSFPHLQKDRPDGVLRKTRRDQVRRVDRHTGKG
jgi:hypothetical protein